MSAAGGAASSANATGGGGINVLSLGVGMSVQGSAPVSSLDFHGQGEYLVSGSENGACVRAPRVMSLCVRVTATGSDL